MKDDKKKLMVLGALAVVVLGVGAFSFLGGSSTPPPSATVAKETEKKTDDAKTITLDKDGNPVPGTEEGEPLKNPLYAADLPQRDPFQTRPLPGEEVQAPPVTQPRLPAPTQPVRRGGGRRSSGGDGGYGPYRPPAMTGELPMAGGPVTVTPTGPDPSTFGYSLSGTMTGQRPVAVFTDSNGNQRMVPVGGSLDGDSKVVAVEKGSVTIEYRGKKQRLSLGGNPK